MLDLTPRAHSFGQQLACSFHQEARSAPFSEIRLFRALISAFGRLRGRFRVAEYHGSRHQVQFNGAGSWGRSPARCELCDVVFLAYSVSGGFRARVTFLQAKRSTERHPNLCAACPSGTDALAFAANLKQWDLLSRRPAILPVPPFKIHPHVLKRATLPSIGSFGVFHRRQRGQVEFFYCAADQLLAVGAPRSRYGRLELLAGKPLLRTLGGHSEIVFSGCLPLFGAALYGLKIGSPLIVRGIVPVAGSDGAPAEAWVRTLLQFHRQASQADNALIGELLELLPGADDTEDSDLEAGPSLVIVRSDVAA
jgi:hypothetical protein